MVNVITIKPTTSNIKIGYVAVGENLATDKVLSAQVDIKSIGALYDIPVGNEKLSIQVSLSRQPNKPNKLSLTKRAAIV